MRIEMEISGDEARRWIDNPIRLTRSDWIHTADVKASKFVVCSLFEPKGTQSRLDFITTPEVDLEHIVRNAVMTGEIGGAASARKLRAIKSLRRCLEKIEAELMEFTAQINPVNNQSTNQSAPKTTNL